MARTVGKRRFFRDDLPSLHNWHSIQGIHQIKVVFQIDAETNPDKFNLVVVANAVRDYFATMPDPSFWNDPVPASPISKTVTRPEANLGQRLSPTHGHKTA
ncbi:MAG: hypothetical protein GY904_26025 [Planctomycetaceae bacterium]|nr:hypothetical protein [Planctomycetaceae bacterium]